MERKKKSSVLQRIRARIPLYTRLYVAFQAEWINEHIPSDRQANRKEITQAATWAKKMTEMVLKETRPFMQKAYTVGKRSYPVTFNLMNGSISLEDAVNKFSFASWYDKNVLPKK